MSIPAAKALVSLHIYAGLPEPSLLHNALSTKVSHTGPYISRKVHVCVCVHQSQGTDCSSLTERR